MKISSPLMIQNDRLYDLLKHITQIVLPAGGTLYFALSQIWGFPNGEEVVGTILALTAFLGVTLGISTAAYRESPERFDGTIDIFEDEDSKSFVLNIDEDPYELEKKSELTFKVNPS